MIVLQRDVSGAALPSVLRLTNSQRLEFGTTATQTTAIATPVARIAADINCYYAYGTSPTATNSSHYLPAGMVEYIAVLPGDRFSPVSATGATGVFHVSETI